MLPVPGSRGLYYQTQFTETAIGMSHTTRLRHNELIDLCILINSAERVPSALKWPPIHGPFRFVAVTLTYMRHNRTQAE